MQKYHTLCIRPASSRTAENYREILILCCMWKCCAHAPKSPNCSKTIVPHVVLKEQSPWGNVHSAWLEL